MKVLIALATLVTVSLSRPRFLVIPMEDVEFGQNMNFPVYRLPTLARQARAAQEDLESAGQDSFQIAPLPAQPRQFNAYPGTRREDSEAAGSSSYGAPPSKDHVDYGGYTGNYGAFGWYTDHPVLLASGHGYH